MLRVLLRAAVAAAAGAVVGAGLLLLLYPSRSAVVLEMDRDLPPFLTGTYAPERNGNQTFVWTSSRAVLRLAGLDRRGTWTCRVRLRGARDSSLVQPRVTISYDGAGGTTRQLGNDFEEIALEIPVRPGRPGLTLAADVGPTFVPGGADTRVLGAQIDWLRCDPDARVGPPSGAVGTAAFGTAVTVAAAALAAAPAVLVAALALVAGAGLAVMLSFGGAFGPYPGLLWVLFTGAAAVVLLVARAPRIAGRLPLSGPALVAVCASALLGVLKLAALSHPAKPLIDAVFHAHRLEWVMAGRYFFTQPLPDGVQFPYAIGLYAVAAPLAGLITDHVLLLRTVVIAVEAVGGLLLYAVIVRGFGDRTAGVLAVVLFHLVPLPYVVIGNANLTNAFAQAVGLTALCGLALMPLPVRGWSRWAAAIGVCALTTLAFLSHISTIVLLAGTLGVAVVAFAATRREPLTRLAGLVVVMTMLAAVLAVGLYYRHFTDVYRDAFERVRAPAAEQAGTRPAGEGPAVLSRQLAWHERATNTALQTVADVGWPVLLLALAGGLMRLGRSRERVPVLLLAWLVAWGLFLGGGTVTRVETQFQRYAAEFVARVNLAGYPALVMLAAIGVTALGRRGKVPAAVAAMLTLAAAALGLGAWLQWSG